MAYNNFEISAQDGRPVELSEFRYGPTFYRYTSADVAITTPDTRVFAPLPINRNAIEDTSEVARTPLNVTIEGTAPICELYRFGPPSEVVLLTVYRYHRGDNEIATIWAGRLTNIKWQGMAATITCESIYSSIKRPGLRRMYQRQCPHVLFSAACGVSSSAAREEVTLVTVSGVTLGVTGLSQSAANYYAGGYVEWEFAPGKVERRAIRSSAAGSLVVGYPIRDIAGGATVRVYPGCDHTLTTCNNKFNNVANYGGMPWIPIKNPFGGVDGPVF